jgi:flavin-dependent dehydrogenase
MVKGGQIFDTDRSLKAPKPVALGYATYCKPFCTWLADRAVDSGAELRTATTAVDVITEDGRVVESSQTQANGYGPLSLSTPGEPRTSSR